MNPLATTSDARRVDHDELLVEPLTGSIGQIGRAYSMTASSLLVPVGRHPHLGAGA